MEGGDDVNRMEDEGPLDLREAAPNPSVGQAQNTEAMPAHIVAANSKCQSEDAKALAMYDIAIKLKIMGNYDIGGTYTGSEPDLWFYFLSSVCPGNNYLMNLFVCVRKKMSLSIGISKYNEIKELKANKKDENCGSCNLPTALSWQIYNATHPDECFYVKTFCFSNSDLKTLENHTLYIPIRIELNSRHVLDSEVVTRIKVDHQFGALLAKQEKSDLTLESASRKTFPTHKVILAAHSPILKELIKDDKVTSIFLDMSDADIELMLQFIYTGTIKDIMEQDCFKLLQIAERFQLKNLLLLTQYVVRDQIDLSNAVEIASISTKYKLDILQTTVFNFIKNHPEVIETEGWKNLNDPILLKKMFEYIQQRVPS